MTILRSLRRLLSGHADRPVVAMLHPGRCGSTVLGVMLGDRPDVAWAGEIFHPSRFGDASPAPEAITARVRGVRDAHAGTGCVFAVKYLWSHDRGRLGVPLPELVDLLDGAGVTHYVALHRRNYLRRVVSGAVGRVKKSYHQRADAGPPELITLRLDPQEVPFGPPQPLLEVFGELEDGERELQAVLAGRRALWLTYEDDIEDDPATAYRDVCRFLGLAEHDVDARYRRTTPFPLDTVVENYEEIRRLLADGPYASFLD
jgi:hypothetical protein